MSHPAPRTTLPSQAERAQSAIRVQEWSSFLGEEAAEEGAAAVSSQLLTLMSQP